MSYHPSGIQVDIVGIEQGNRGRSCEEHNVCGKVLDLDVVVRLRSVQIINGLLVLSCSHLRLTTVVSDEGEEETAIAAVLRY